MLRARWGGVLIGGAAIVVLAAWTGLRFPAQYDELPHRAFSERLATQPFWHTIVTYDGSENYEAKAPLVFAIAAAFGAVAGFSLPGLRLLALLFAFTGLFAFGRLVELLGASVVPWWRSALLICVPYVIVLSLTFMTDVPCLAFLLFALCGYLKYLDEPAWRHLALGVAMATAASYVRVDYLFILVGLAVSVSMDRRLTAPMAAALALPFLLRAPLVVVWGGLAAPPAQTRPHPVGMGFELSHLVFTLAILGLYFWPLVQWSQGLKTRRALVIAAGSGAAAVLACVWWMPGFVASDVDRYAGTLRTVVLAYDHPAFRTVLIVALVIAGIGAAATCAGTAQSGDPKRHAVLWCGLVGILIQTIRGPVIYERYLIQVSVLALLLFAPLPIRRGRWMLWTAWVCGIQVVQLIKNGVLP